MFETSTSVWFIVYHPDDNSWTDMDNVQKSSSALYVVPSSGSLTIECHNFHCINVQRFVDPVPHVQLPHVQRTDGLFNDVTLNALCACEVISILFDCRNEARFTVQYATIRTDCQWCAEG